jgi:hypothetical protein
MRLGRSRSIAVGLALGAAFVVPHLAGGGWETDQELAARMERENNPVKKAKIEIRLGRQKLTHALEACEKDDHPRCQEFLGSFLALMKSSWARLKATGRVAAKQVDGFKELDIALREGSRQLEDLKQRVPYQDIGEIDSAEKETDQLRAEVLRALFPALDVPEGATPPRKHGHGKPPPGASP